MTVKLINIPDHGSPYFKCDVCLDWSDAPDFARRHLKECPGMKDQVNHPAHYTAGGIEVLDIFKAKLTPEEYRGALKANVLKYLFRERHKGSGPEDLKKARFYLNLLIDEDPPTSPSPPHPSRV